jgi:hypothetical protein
MFVNGLLKENRWCCYNSRTVGRVNYGKTCWTALDGAANYESKLARPWDGANKYE